MSVARRRLVVIAAFLALLYTVVMLSREGDVDGTSESDAALSATLWDIRRFGGKVTWEGDKAHIDIKQIPYGKYSDVVKFEAIGNLKQATSLVLWRLQRQRGPFQQANAKAFAELNKLDNLETILFYGAKLTAPEWDVLINQQSLRKLGFSESEVDMGPVPKLTQVTDLMIGQGYPIVEMTPDELTSVFGMENLSKLGILFELKGELDHSHLEQVADSKLKSLVLHGVRSDALVSSVLRMKNLEELSLVWLPDSSIIPLLSAPRLKRLELLGWAPPEWVSELEKSPSLQELYLWEPHPDERASVVQECIKSGHLLSTARRSVPV